MLLKIICAVKLTFVASLPAKTDQTEYSGPTDIISCSADSNAIRRSMLDYKNWNTQAFNACCSDSDFFFFLAPSLL